MTKLVLGVIDQPYSNAKTTTADVAGYLETKYGIMAYFWQRNQDQIMSLLEDGMQSTFSSYMMGAPFSMEPFASGTEQINKMFREFLFTKQMDGKIPGVPTMASLKGVSSRFKKRRGPVRPSFIDTGLYEANFRSWVET